MMELRELHKAYGGKLMALGTAEIIADYGDWLGEYRALTSTAGVIDLSSRGRLCLAGADRVRFLNGQVTNNVKTLGPGMGCYAALVTAKGKIQSDLNIYNLDPELLLDFEPNLSELIQERLEKFIIADDVQVIDVSPFYGLLSVLGPKAAAIVAGLDVLPVLPAKEFAFVRAAVGGGELYCMNQPRLGAAGFDLFIPRDALPRLMSQLVDGCRAAGGGPCGWTAFETARIERGAPRFGQDMDETNLAPETGLEERAISYDKGCYIGQEVIARIRTYGQVAKHLVGLAFDQDASVPERGAKLWAEDKEVGYVTSAVLSPRFQRVIGLGYVRKEHNSSGTILAVGTPDSGGQARVVSRPFQSDQLNG